MPRQPRRALPDGVFHVTARAISGHDLFADDDDRRRFLWLLGATAAGYDVRVLAYCLMGTHYHLLVESTTAELAGAMQHLNGRYAQRFNDRHERNGHVFGQRYSAYVLRDEQHLEDSFAYIAANPVKAGLCDNADDWPWTWIADGSGCAMPAPAAGSA